jgi:hypothetical protein
MYYTWKESSGRALLRGVLENCETQSIILLELKMPLKKCANPKYVKRFIDSLG